MYVIGHSSDLLCPTSPGPFHRHRVAGRRICQEIFSAPAPAGAGFL